MWINNRGLYSVGFRQWLKDSAMGWMGYEVGIDHAFTYSFYPIRWNKYVEETITRVEKVAERNGADLTDPEVGLTVLVAIREGLAMGMTEQARELWPVLKDIDPKP